MRLDILAVKWVTPVTKTPHFWSLKAPTPTAMI